MAKYKKERKEVGVITLMGTKELAETFSENILKSEILLLENHEVLTAGISLLQAFDKIEVLESAAKMTLITEVTNKKTLRSKSGIIEIERLIR